MKTREQIEQAIEELRSKTDRTDGLYSATLHAYQQGQIDGLKWVLKGGGEDYETR